MTLIIATVTWFAGLWTGLIFEHWRSERERDSQAATIALLMMEVAKGEARLAAAQRELREGTL